MKSSNLVELGARVTIILVAMLLALPVSAQEADCDCSCQAHAELDAAARGMQSGDPDAQSTMMQHIQCIGACSEAWSHCAASDSERENRAQREEQQREKAQADAEAIREWLGEPRDDLERFYGVYGATPDSTRQFFATQAVRPKYHEKAPEIPPGYLQIGPMWGDVEPWNMKSLSETRFVHNSRGDFGLDEPLIAVFEVGADGRAVVLTFESIFDDYGPLQRLGDLPEDWQ